MQPETRKRRRCGTPNDLRTRAGWVSSELEARRRIRSWSWRSLPPRAGCLGCFGAGPRSLVWEVDMSESEERPLPSASRPAVTGLRPGTCSTGQAVRPLAKALPRPAGSDSVLIRALREAVQLGDHWVSGAFWCSRLGVRS